MKTTPANALLVPGGRIRTVYGLFLLACALAACSGDPGAVGDVPPDTSQPLTANSVLQAEFLTASGVDCGGTSMPIFNIEAAAGAPVLLPSLEAGTLGEAGARELAGELFSRVGSVCGLSVDPRTEAIIEEAVGLGESGQTGRALDLLESHLEELRSGGGGGKLAAPRRYDRADRERLKGYLIMEALAQKYGPPDAGYEYREAAQSLLREFANRDLPGADPDEALAFLMDSLLFGQEDVAAEARQRFRDALEADRAAFDPCTATEEDLRRLQRTISNTLLLGGDLEDARETGNLWKQAQEILLRRSRGEEIPECDRAVGFEWTHTHGGGMTTAGSAFTCDGTAWHIDFELVWIDLEFTAETTGSLDFEVVDGTSGLLQLPTEGTIIVLDSSSLTVIDPLDFQLTLNEDGETAIMVLASTGAGSMFVPGVTDSDPDDMGTVFPREEIPVELGPTTRCEN